MKDLEGVFMRHLITAFAIVVALGVSAAASGEKGDADTPPASAETARREAFFRKNIVDAYEKVGQHDPSWDSDARKALDLSVRRWMLSMADPDIDVQILYYADHAVLERCRDPLVLYNQMHAMMASPSGVYPDPDILKDLESNATGSKYAPFLKAYTFIRLGRYAQWMAGLWSDATQTRQRLMREALDNLPGMLAEREIPQAKLADICVDLTEMGLAPDGDRKPTIDRISQMMAKAQPDAPLAELFKGIAYRKYAWDARGNGFAGTVTAEGWRRFAERLAVAKEALDAALNKDPNCAAAAAEMISVQLGSDGNRAEMEKYFQRAIAADPGCYAAYDRKLYWLAPKWHGTADDQLAFGRECLATKRWDDRIPFLLLQSQKNIVEDRFRELSATAQTEWERQHVLEQALAELHKVEPSTWKDVQNLYEGYLAYNPQAVSARMDYRAAAESNGHSEIVKQQNDVLNANHDPAFKLLIHMPGEELAVAGAFKARGLRLQASGDAKDALPDLEQYAKRLQPNDQNFYYSKLWIWMTRVQLGDKEAADRDLAAYQKMRDVKDPHEWHAALIAFFLGQLKEPDLLAAAEASDASSRSGNLCEAWYYAGKIRSIAGDDKTAAEYFAKCIATGQQNYDEYNMAQVELQRLRSAPDPGGR